MTNTEPPRRLQVINPSPPSPKEHSKEFTIATTRMNSRRVQHLIPASIPNPDTTIKIHLLRTQCYLSLGTPNLALQQADVALYIAQQNNLCKLEAKSQFYRAKCFMEMESWREARWALVRAASLRDFEMEIMSLGEVCDAQIELEQLTVQYERKVLKEFEERERAERGD